MTYSSKSEQSDQTNTVQEPDKSDKSQPEASDESKAPEGFVEYRNDELGFKFNYPKEWGGVIDAPEFASRDLIFAGSFDKNDRVFFGLASKDYVKQHLGGDPNCFDNGFGPFEFRQILDNGASYYNEEIYKTSDRQIVKSYKSGYCTGAKMEARVKLDLSKSNGIDITYFDQKEPQYVGSELITAGEYMKNQSNLIPQPTETQFKELVESVEKI